MTPFPTATPLPAPTATPTTTIPQFYADLPSLPETIPLGTEDIAPFDFPEITVADGQDIIRTPMSLIGYVADTNWWPIIRYTMHLMVAMAMLFRIGGFTL